MLRLLWRLRTIHAAFGAVYALPWSKRFCSVPIPSISKNYCWHFHPIKLKMQFNPLVNLIGLIGLRESGASIRCGRFIGWRSPPWLQRSKSSLMRDWTGIVTGIRHLPSSLKSSLKWRKSIQHFVRIRPLLIFSILKLPTKFNERICQVPVFLG